MDGDHQTRLHGSWQPGRGSPDVAARTWHRDTAGRARSAARSTRPVDQRGRRRRHSPAPRRPQRARRARRPERL